MAHSINERFHFRLKKKHTFTMNISFKWCSCSSKSTPEHSTICEHYLCQSWTFMSLLVFITYIYNSFWVFWKINQTFYTLFKENHTKQLKFESKWNRFIYHKMKTNSKLHTVKTTTMYTNCKLQTVKTTQLWNWVLRVFFK